MHRYLTLVHFLTEQLDFVLGMKSNLLVGLEFSPEEFDGSLNE